MASTFLLGGRVRVRFNRLCTLPTDTVECRTNVYFIDCQVRSYPLPCMLRTNQFCMENSIIYHTLSVSTFYTSFYISSSIVKYLICKTSMNICKCYGLRTLISRQCSFLFYKLTNVTKPYIIKKLIASLARKQCLGRPLRIYLTNQWPQFSIITSDSEFILIVKQ